MECGWNTFAASSVKEILTLIHHQSPLCQGPTGICTGTDRDSTTWTSGLDVWTESWLTLQNKLCRQR